MDTNTNTDNIEARFRLFRGAMLTELHTAAQSGRKLADVDAVEALADALRNLRDALDGDLPTIESEVDGPQLWIGFGDAVGAFRIDFDTETDVDGATFVRGRVQRAEARFLVRF